MPTVPQLKNPTLEWDNLTPTLHGVPVERPDAWLVAQPDATHKDNTLGMFHRPGGFGIDAGDKTGALVLYQTDIYFPAGTYALRIDLLSHVRREGPWDAKWEVAVITPGGKTTSVEMWVTSRKGSNPLIGIIHNTQPATGALELRYTVHYASTHGEMQIRRVRFTDTLPPTPNFRLTLQHTPADIDALQPRDWRLAQPCRLSALHPAPAR
jgi:hypothetical protein